MVLLTESLGDPVVIVDIVMMGIVIVFLDHHLRERLVLGRIEVARGGFFFPAISFVFLWLHLAGGLRCRQLISQREREREVHDYMEERRVGYKGKLIVNWQFSNNEVFDQEPTINIFLFSNSS